MNNRIVIKIFVTIMFVICIESNIYGISDNFKFVIDTIGIPRYNVYSEEINEDMYYTYNIFAYSKPEALSWNRQQRFKSVPSLGKWTRSNGPYKGEGERGEYYLLGTSYSGAIVSNVYFPSDFLPETTPNLWNFIYTQGAYESWLDTGKYKYYEQLDYMKKADLLFDEINYAAGTINSYNLVSYNISVNKIGMDKMTLDASSTWKTNGIVTARRINNKSQIRSSIFATAPMAASANVLSKLNVNDNFAINKNEDKINIPVTISAEATNLTNYASEKHIKEIVSVLYINGKEVTRVSGSKTVKVDKNILFTVSREDYSISKTYPIDIKVKSYLYTEFSVDGLMQNEIQKRVNLQVLEKEVIPINSIKIKTLEKDNNNLVVRPLVQTINTNNYNSKGIIEAGRYIAVKIKKNIDNINIECYINDSKVNYEEIYKDEKSIILKIFLDNASKNTIKSWNYLRNESNNYFNVDFNKIGERISDPNILKIVCNSNYTDVIKFDSIDKFNANMNYSFDSNVTNTNDILSTMKLKEWSSNEE